ncbi:cell division protein FtsQ/DivIB [Paracoccus jiaweipingae]|uniref:cell division protein FtsQ/DivIB n=1 Tax=unclassified Paracoccus (in: a-proteobacteria) TaxID=2688777 RepID=UPI0037925891
MQDVTRHEPGFGLSGGNQPVVSRIIRRDTPPQPARRKPRRDPAPSRLKYRLERLMLRPRVRRAVRIGGPVVVVALLALGWLADDGRRGAMVGWVQDRIQQVQHNDAFMIKTMEVQGASPAVDKGLRAMLPVALPASSFDIDLARLRQQAMSLDAIESVDLRVRDGGILSAVVVERKPALLWRHASGIEMLDAQGHRVASVTSRDLRQDLPMIAGLGGDAAAPEALRLIAQAGPVLPRLRGLERRGERRWDLVLDHGQRIMLPATGAEAALQQVLEWDAAQDILGRDVDVVDLRDPARPRLRIGLAAQNALRQARGLPLLGPDGKELPPQDKKS